MVSVGSRAELIALALALGARSIDGWSESEEEAVAALPSLPTATIAAAKLAIQRGQDPLGDIFCRLFSPEQRRPLGATYTPDVIIAGMLAWAAAQLDPTRVVDPGAGSARFLVAAGRKFPQAELVAVELDPVAAVLARGHLAAAGLMDRSKVVVRDYREVVLPPINGRTLYLGNPPYVRHHLLGPQWKAWLAKTARKHGLEASGLAGPPCAFLPCYRGIRV